MTRAPKRPMSAQASGVHATVRPVSEELAELRAELTKWRHAAQSLGMETWTEDLSEDLSSLSIVMATHVDDRAQLRLAIERASTDPDRPQGSQRHRIIESSGAMRWLDTSLRVERRVDVPGLRLWAVSIDVTESVNARETATESRILADRVAEGIFVADATGRYVDANEHACRMLGYSRDELFALKVTDLVPCEDLETAPLRIKELRIGEALQTQRRLRRKDGSLVEVELVTQRLSASRVCGIARDVTERRAIERARDQSEETLRELGSRFPALLWVREVETGRLVYLSAGWGAFIDMPSTGETFHRLLDVVHPEDRAAMVEGSKLAVTGQWESTVQFVDRAGDAAWHRVVAFAIRDARGEPYRVAGFAVNVSERIRSENAVRTALEEKEILRREVHHRVKNNLQVVSSLLSLQAMKVRDPALSALLSESQGRVSAMALVYEVLHRSRDFARIPFGPYARALGGSVCRMYGVGPATITLVVEAGDAALDIDTAIPCGLLLNEILSNSLEHAFPDGARGTLRIELIERATGWYRLRVCDDGVGLPPDFEMRHRSALGAKLIERLVEQLRGSMSRISSDGGTRYEVEFPRTTH